MQPPARAGRSTTRTKPSSSAPIKRRPPNPKKRPLPASNQRQPTFSSLRLHKKPQPTRQPKMKQLFILAPILALIALYWVASAHVIFRVSCAVATFFSAPPIVLANDMDIGLKATPNQASFMRFTSKALWLPTSSIHGFELGNILMVNSNYG